MNPVRRSVVLLLLMVACNASAGSLPQRSRGGLLVGGGGQTLYTYDPDGTSNQSRCSASCTAVWPPYPAEAGDKAKGDYSVMQRADGTRQWAYRGRPLYLFVGDAKPGDHDGDGVNGSWHVVR